MALNKLQRDFLEHCVVQADTGMSDAEFGEMCGVNPRTLKSWKTGERCPEFRKLLAAAKKEYEESHSIFGQKTYLWALEEAIVNYKSAKKAKDAGEARKWWQEIAKLSKPKDEGGPRVDYANWTDEDLDAEVYKRGLTPEEEAVTRLREVGGM